MQFIENIAGSILGGMLLVCNYNYIVAICLFAFVVRIISNPILYLGRRLSDRYYRLKPEIERIKDSGADVHEVEKQLTELYEKHNVNCFHLLIRPVTHIINLVILTGFIGSICNPITSVLKFSGENLSILANTYGTNNQLSLVRAFLDNSEAVRSLLPLEKYTSLNNFANAMVFDGQDLSQVPTLQTLIIFPIILLILQLIKCLLSVVYGFYLNGKVNKRAIGIDVCNVLIMLLFAFSCPAGMCIYWCAGSVLSIISALISFLPPLRRRAPKGKPKLQFFKKTHRG